MTAEYYQYLMRYRDERFSKNERFLYVAQNTAQRHRTITAANIYVRDKTFANKSVAEIKQAINENKKLTDSVAAFSGSLRGIRTYWKKRSGELLNMVEQLGQPHVFFTLSAADCRWPDIANIINRNNNERENSNSEKVKLMNQNPMLTSFLPSIQIVR